MGWKNLRMYGFIVKFAFGRFCGTSRSWGDALFERSQERNDRAMVTCPACDAVLDVEEEELDEGDELTCDECGETLTVSSTDPLELACQR